MEIRRIHDIVEENGLTIKENNMEKRHLIPINALVEVNVENNDGYHPVFHKIRLYITEHRRDCDGTPLYSLGLKGEKEPHRMFHGFSEEVLKVISR